MKTVILAGGLGTRLAEETVLKPKPMVEIGGRPILWHLMRYYASFGHKEFLVALGYRSESIKRFFLEYAQLQGSMTVDLTTGTAYKHTYCPDDWQVHLHETGATTQTGGRIKRLTPLLEERFMMTYGDGLSSVDIGAVLAFHERHGRLATVVGVHPPARFGGLFMDGDEVTAFLEKSQLTEGWINGGFFVLEPEVVDYIDSDETPFEGKPLERLAADRQLMVYRHEGFWQCMDTLRDVRLLNDLWARGDAPWSR